MNVRAALAAVVAASFVVAGAGCAVSRGQESVGSYVDDAAITSTVKAHMVEDTAVDAAAITVETLNGSVIEVSARMSPMRVSNNPTCVSSLK